MGLCCGLLGQLQFQTCVFVLQTNNLKLGFPHPAPNLTSRQPQHNAATDEANDKSNQNRYVERQAKSSVQRPKAEGNLIQVADRKDYNDHGDRQRDNPGKVFHSRLTDVVYRN
jgi:hypothetical protein